MNSILNNRQKKNVPPKRPLILASLLVAQAVLSTLPACAADAPVTPTSPPPFPRLTLDAASTIPADLPTPDSASGNDLSKLSLEDLMNIEVTSVSKQKQRIGDAAAAVYVITEDDIRRSGMNSIPELLRLVPGIHVAQAESGKWAVGSRGFTQAKNDNLLVLIDGRTVYTPLFAGVYWDSLDPILSDLDRIEVIRGPGATLWGSNAVNGVINITTKSARDTQGFLFQDYTGNDGYIGNFRYGGNVDQRVFFRVYGKYRSMEDFNVPSNPALADGWDIGTGGFRIDADLTERDAFTLQGDFFDERLGDTTLLPSLTPPYNAEITEPINTSGANLLTRWTHTISSESDFSLQLYYDRLSRNTNRGNYSQDTYDIEFQHRFPLLDIHEIIWGAGYRMVADSIVGAIPSLEGNHTLPLKRDNGLANAFVQDDITVLPKLLHFIVGTKLELNPYTNLEVQPSARALFTPNEHNTLWLGVSRAVRSPARWEEDINFFSATVPPSTANPLPTEIVTTGNRDLKSEQLLAFEAGYRVEPIPKLSIDIAGFYNLHKGMREILPAGSPSLAFAPAPHVIVPTAPFNAADGASYGLELSTRYKVFDNWQLAGSYSYLGVNLHNTTGIDDGGFTEQLEHNAPAHQFQLHSYYNITKDIELNSALYYTGPLEVEKIPAYFRGDINVVWRPEKHTELTAGVRNIFDSGHPEFFEINQRSSTTEVPRTFFIELSVRF